MKKTLVTAIHLISGHELSEIVGFMTTVAVYFA